jgi:hypothetical protein
MLIENGTSEITIKLFEKYQRFIKKFLNNEGHFDLNVLTKIDKIENIDRLIKFLCTGGMYFFLQNK